MRHIAWIGLLLIATVASADDVGTAPTAEPRGEPTLYQVEPIAYQPPEVSHHQEVQPVSEEPEVASRDHTPATTRMDMNGSGAIALAAMVGVVAFIAGRRV